MEERRINPYPDPEYSCDHANQLIADKIRLRRERIVVIFFLGFIIAIILFGVTGWRSFFIVSFPLAFVSVLTAMLPLLGFRCSTCGERTKRKRIARVPYTLEFQICEKCRRYAYMGQRGGVS
jgi:hypothetical protein